MSKNPFEGLDRNNPADVLKAAQMAGITRYELRKMSPMMNDYLNGNNGQSNEQEDQPGVISDLWSSFGVGAGNLVSAAGSLYGLATGDMDNGATRLGEQVSDYWNKEKSNVLTELEQGRRDAINNSDSEFGKFGNAIWETVSNPRLLASFVSEQIPMFAVPGGAGAAGAKAGTAYAAKKGTELAAKKFGSKVGVAAGVGTGAAMQGGDVGANTYEELIKLPEPVWEQNPEYLQLKDELGNAEAAKEQIALSYGRKASAIAGTLSIGSQFIPGGATIEKAMAGNKFTGGLMGRAAKGFAGEGAQEIIEEGGGKVISNSFIDNIDENQGLFEGVGESSGLGLLGGGVMGGTMAAISGAPNIESTKQQYEAKLNQLRESGKKAVAEGDTAAAQQIDNDLKQTQASYTEFLKEYDPGFVSTNLNKQQQAKADKAAQGGDALDQELAAAQAASTIADDVAKDSQVKMEAQQGLMGGMNVWQPNFTMPGSEQEQAQQVDGEYIANTDYPTSVPLGNSLGFDESVGEIDAMPENRVGQSDTIFASEQREELPAPERLGLPDRFTNVIPGQDRTSELDAQEQMRQAQFNQGTERATVRSNGNPFPTVKSTQASRSYRQAIEDGLNPEIVKVGNGFGWETQEDVDRGELFEAEAVTEQVEETQPITEAPTIEQPQSRSLLDTGRTSTQSRPTKAVTPQGREVGVQYRVVDASEVINSNDENGIANPDFPQEYQNRNRSRSASTQQIRNIANKLNPEQVDYGNMSTDGAPIVSQDGIVESGNGRVAGIKLAYKQGKANAYREYLEAQGYDTEGLREPLLVRVRTTDMTPEERRQFVTESNERTTLSLSATEKAKDDANIISRIATDFMGGDVDNVANAGFVRKFMQGISSTEAAELTDAEGRLSQTGKRRIEAALLFNAYGDERVVTDLFESSDNDIKSIGGALLDNAGQWAKMRQQAPTELDMTNNVIEAVNLVKQARREGRSVQELVGQQDIFAGEISPETDRALRMMYGPELKRAVSRKALSEKLSQYATLASNVNPEPGLFGDEVDSVSSNDLMDQINGTENTTNDIQESLFNVEDSAGRREEGEQPSGNDTLTEDNQSLREPESQEVATQEPPEGGFFTPDESANKALNVEFEVDNFTTTKTGRVKDGLDIVIKDLEGNIIGAVQSEKMSDGSLQVFNASLDEGQRGKGIGLGAYKKLISEARASGVKVITSDNSVSDSAASIWEKLGAKKMSENTETLTRNDNGRSQIFSSKDEAVYSLNITPGESNQNDTNENQEQTFEQAIDKGLDDALNELDALLKEQKGTLNSGVNPQIMLAVARVGGYAVAKGAVKFSNWIKQVLSFTRSKGISDSDVLPYLKESYGAISNNPEKYGVSDNIADTMSLPKEVRQANIEEIANDQRTTRNAQPNSEIQNNTPNTKESAGDGERGRIGSVVDGNEQEDSGESSTAIQPSLSSGSGSESNQPGREGEPNDTKSTAADIERERVSSDSASGLLVEQSASKKTRDNNYKQPSQESRLEVKSGEFIPSDINQIKQTMPFLTDGQANDVVFAENRLFKPNGFGVLFTNGTGTGKTFSGLGVAKRYAQQGKNRILIIAPKQPILTAWVNAGKEFFNLDISILQSTKDSGSGIVATTYANLGQNSSVIADNFDLVIADEAHYLSSGGEGVQTSSLKALRAIAKQKDQATRITEAKNPDGIMDKLDKVRGKLDALKGDITQEQQAKKESLNKDYDNLLAKKREYVKAEQERLNAIKDEDRPRTVMLSATPFAYDKSVVIGQGFLFDWNGGEVDNNGSAYNSGSNFDQFMMQHFGYRMRYNKLTRPESDVNSDLMERQFNKWLKENGVISGRMLDSAFDYDRKFVEVESRIGVRIDEALNWLWEKSTQSIDEKDVKDGGVLAEKQSAKDAYSWLHKSINDKFGYFERMYLLEAIKASEVVPYIEQHIEANRNVLVIHDFKKGGAGNPFKQVSPKTPEERSVYEEFKQEFKDVVNSFDFLPSVIDTLSRAFPNALIYNGSVSPKNRVSIQNKFNDDENKNANIIIAQGDAMREGVSIHDTTGKNQRVLIHLGLPVKPTASIQQEGRIYRTGQASDAIFRYFTIGTNWERSAFSKIAQRAGTAENLAMGELARGLRQSFITAYENAGDYPAGMDSEGKGGKEQDQSMAATLSEFDLAKSLYFGTKKYGSGRSASREGEDYFATPEPIGLKMVEFASIQPNEAILEPSAGHGAIARWMPETSRRRAIEPSLELSSRLSVNFNGEITTSSFEDHNVINKYDAIVMNPPYGQGGAKARDHVEKAIKHLRNNGRIVALIPTGPAADKKFDKLLFDNEQTKDIYIVANIKLPSVTFSRAGTGVMTRILVLEKQTDQDVAQTIQEQNGDYTGITDINELFDRIQNYNVKERDFNEQATVDKKVIDSVKNSDSGSVLQRMDSKHSKTGKPLYVVNFDGDMGHNYDSLNSLAKDNNGFYIRAKLRRYYKPNDGVSVQGVPTFNFESESDREAFIEQAQSVVDESPMFSLGDNRNPTTTGNRAAISSTDANKVIDSIISSWTGGIKARRNEFVVAPTFDDLPSDIKDAAKQQGAEGKVYGVFHNGKTYVVLDKHNSTQELETTIFHETYGHHGMRKLFGNEITQKMNQLFAANGGMSGLKAKAEQHGIDLNLYIKGTEQAGMPQEVRNRVLMEELLAHMQQDNKPSVKRMAKEVVGYIRQKLRDLGFAKLANLSDSDLFYLLKQSRDAVRKGSAKGGEVRLMMGEKDFSTYKPSSKELRYQRAKATLNSSEEGLDIDFVDDQFGSYIDINENQFIKNAFGVEENIGEISVQVAFIDGSLYEMDPSAYFYKDEDPYWSPVVTAPSQRVAKIYKKLDGKSYPIVKADGSSEAEFNKLIQLKNERGFVYNDGVFERKGSANGEEVRFMMGRVSEEQLIAEGLNDPREVAYQESVLESLKQSDNPFDARKAEALEGKLEAAKRFFQNELESNPQNESEENNFSLKPDGIIKDTGDYLSVSIKDDSNGVISEYRLSKVPDDGYYTSEVLEDGEWKFDNEFESIDEFAESIDDINEYLGGDRINQNLSNGMGVTRESIADGIVKDGNGKPKTLYHGTGSTFESFDRSKLGTMTGADSSKIGFFFTDNKALANNFRSESSLKTLDLPSYEKQLSRLDDAEFVEVVDQLNLQDDLELEGREFAERLIIERLEEDQGAYFDDRSGVKNILDRYISKPSKGSLKAVNLKINNPLVVDASKLEDYQDGFIVNVLGKAQKNGNDGVIIKNMIDAATLDDKGNGGIKSTVYVVFESDQIIGKNDFDTPLFRTANEQTATAPVEKRWSKDWFKRKLQDKFAPIKDMQASIEGVTGQALPEEQDTYRAEELFYGKTENDLNKMEDNHVKPLVDAMTQNNIEAGELDQYLMAKHAKERNKHIASINPEMPDGGSGMTNKEAAEILSRYADEGKLAGLSIAANEVYKITAKRRQLLRESGLEDEALLDVWDAGYQFYVPLKGFANDSEGNTIAKTGKGFDIRGKESMKAMGRRTMAESPTAHAIQDLSATIIRARKNEVAQTFLNMVESNPNPEIWEVFTDENPDTERRMVNGEVKENQPIDMRYRKDDYFAVKVDGKTKYIKLKDKDGLLMNAMKNMGPAQVNGFTKAMGAATRWLSMVNTSLNPEFTVTNFTRDIQTALFNALAEQDLTDGKVKDKQIAGSMVKGTGKAVGALYKHARGKLDQNDPMHTWIEEFLADGAKTGYFDSKDVDQIGKDMSSLLDMTKGTNKGKILKAKKKVFDFVENINGSIENGVRLSAYIEARRAGVSRNKAASFAKNLTVNFNRKGEAGTFLNSVYMFFNAAVQGNVNFARAILTPKVDEATGKKSLNKAQKIAAGIVGASFGWASLMREIGGEDEDGVPYWDKIPKGVRERSFVILKPGTDGEYFKIPLPYGYNIFYNIGDAMEAAVQSDTRTKGDLAAELALSAYASFVPLGSPVGDNEAESAALVATPTLFKPIVEIATNKNFFGGQIYRENMPYGPELRDSQMSMRSTGEMYKGIARWMNDVMGDGMKYKVDGEAPLYDISPDTIEHIVEFGLGGLYRFGSRMLDTAGTVANGGELDVTSTPFIRQVNGEIRPYEDISNFYDARQELKNIEAELKSRKGKARMEFMQEYRDKYRLRGLMSSIDKRMKLLRKQRDRIEIDDSLSFVEREERLQRIEDKMKSAVATFNEKWNETE